MASGDGGHWAEILAKLTEKKSSIEAGVSYALTQSHRANELFAGVVARIQACTQHIMRPLEKMVRS